MQAQKSDLRYHGNQYGHRVIIQGKLLADICWCLDIPVDECNTPANHERIERWFNKMIQRACREILGEDA
jgi:hypothetical protein